MLTHYLTIFAKAIVLFTNDAKTLQLQIDKLALFFTWSLKIDKLKYVCLKKKEQTRNCEI